jgi:hypothetical protein
MNTKIERKAAFQALFKASGLTLREAPKVLKVSVHTLTAHIKTEDTTAGPSIELIERLRDIVVTKAKAVLAEGWKDEARNPLPKEEVQRLPAQQLDFRISFDDEHGEGSGTYPLDIVGRTGLLARVEIPRKGRSLEEIRGEILQTAWDTYRRGININLPELTPEQERIRLKQRLQMLRDGLGLNNIELAEMTGRSVPGVRAWLDLKRDNIPPDAVISDLRTQLQKWAHDVIVVAAQGRDLLLSAADFVPKPSITRVEDSGFSRGRPLKAEPQTM